MVKARRALAMGIALGILLTSCASFSYRFYFLDGTDFKTGKLLGDKPEHDLDFSACEPRADDAHPCVVMLRPDFYQLKQDYLKALADLKACQGG